MDRPLEGFSSSFGSSVFVLKIWALGLRDSELSLGRVFRFGVEGLGFRGLRFKV